MLHEVHAQHALQTDRRAPVAGLRVVRLDHRAQRAHGTIAFIVSKKSSRLVRRRYRSKPAPWSAAIANVCCFIVGPHAIATGFNAAIAGPEDLISLALSPMAASERRAGQSRLVEEERADANFACPTRPVRPRAAVAFAASRARLAELFDSKSGDVIARVVDRREARTTGRMSLSSGSYNQDEARSIAAAWARILRKALDNAHGIAAKG